MLKLLSNDIKFHFKDVLIVPQRSSLDTRRDVMLERTFNFRHTERTWTGVPIVTANMDTVGTFAMAKEFAKHKMLVSLHKHYSVDELANFFIENIEIQNYVFYTVGAVKKDLEKLIAVRELINEKAKKIEKESEKFTTCYYDFPRMICMDAANGYTEFFVSRLLKLRAAFPNAIIMAGNVCTPNMAEELILNGADIVKTGIGGGSVCTTRVKTGVGFPQLSAIVEGAHAVHGIQGQLCGDGGCTCSGDVAKAFAGGADFVMLGGMLTATDECEGDWEYSYLDLSTEQPTVLSEKNKIKSFFKFHGMSSKEAQEKWSGELKRYRAAEGKEVKISYRGPVSDIIEDILGGLRSCGTYIGASRIKDFPKCAQFVRTNVQENRIYN